MLSKEELAAFLALLLEFATVNGLSANRLSQLFHTSVPTTARWLRRARGLKPKNEVKETYIYRHLADPISKKIETLNELNATRGIYAALDGYASDKKVELLQGALDGRIV